jgi:type IV fimbrial biogenesis protein FimT
MIFFEKRVRPVMSNVHFRLQRGFTLTELMVTISIILILASIAVPVYTSLICKIKISSYTSELHAALLLTRSEAIKRGKHVNICRSSNAQSSAPTCATALSNALINTGWAEGWLIYVDANNDTQFNEGDVLIQVQGALIKSVSAGSIIPVPNRNRLTYNATGQIFGVFMRFAVHRPNTDLDTSHDRVICIASGGRARVANLTCA